MEEVETDLLTDSVLWIDTKRRSQLIPWWIKTFMWIFLIFGAAAPLVLILGISGYNFKVSLYGLETNDPISIIGVGIMILFFFKGITAYGLLTEKYWAIRTGIVDAIVGIVICIFITVYPLLNSAPGMQLVFRLELLLLIPYLIKLQKIKPAWENTIVQNHYKPQ